jgi:vacuolar protein sorting-associated protein 52
MPPVVPLLTMIRLSEDVVAEVETRSCPPVAAYVFTVRLQMWPAFQKAMTEHIDALKKLAEGGSSGYFGRGSTITDAVLTSVCHKCISQSSTDILPQDMPEVHHGIQLIPHLDPKRRRNHDFWQVSVLYCGKPMKYKHLPSLLRLRQGLAKLILKHNSKISDPVASATALSATYESLLQGLSVSPRPW